jgi:hypothetical protein
MAVTDVVSQRNKRKFVDDDFFVYVLNNKNKDATIQYWTCEQKNQCRAKVHVSNGRVIKHVGEHTHRADANTVKASVLVADMKHEAETSHDTTRNIIRDAVRQQDDGVLAALPSRATLSRRIQRARRRINPSPPIPTARHGFDIPTAYTTTSNGRRFLMFDSGTDDHDRMLIFSTDENLDAMVSNGNWFMDGTFKCAPEIYYQVFTVHVFINGAVFPVVYALLPNKQQATYERFFTSLNSMRQFQPTSVLVDFEMSSMNAVHTIYPNAAVSGCFFHFSQCIYRKVQYSGLQSEYHNTDFNMFIQMLAALAFVPVNRVADSFDTLLEGHAPVTAQPIIDYFEDNFIGRLTRRNVRRAPLFPMDVWNISGRVDDALPRTNNSVEGWHRAFQSSLSCAHPSLWKFIDQLKKEEALQHFNIIQVRSGASVPGRKKYRCCQGRIRNIVQRYATMSTLDFLKAIAHNLTV